jgi:flagellar basal body-associated protein FliL
VAEEEKPADEAPAAPSVSKGPVIVALLSTLATVGALATLVYTQMLAKRPAITETLERERIKKHNVKVQAGENFGLIKLEPLTINIAADPDPKAAAGQTHPTATPSGAPEGKAGVGQMRYIIVGITLEIRDKDEEKKFDPVKMVFMDRIITLFAEKSFKELSTVQGRYILRSQISEQANDLLTEYHGASLGEIPLVTNVYFTQFLVQ